MTEKKEVTLSQRFFWLTNTIFHQIVTIVVAFIAYVFVKNFDVSSRGFIHIFVTTFAYIPLMAEGFILFNESNTWCLYVKRNSKGWIHGALLIVSLVCVCVGIGVKFYDKNQVPIRKHYQSNHAILGLVSWILCFLLAITGVFALFSSKVKNIIKPVHLRTIHLFLGLACYGIGIGSLILGLDLRSFKSHVTHNELIITKTLVSIIAVWSSIGAIFTLFNNLKSIFT